MTDRNLEDFYMRASRVREMSHRGTRMGGRQRSVYRPYSGWLGRLVRPLVMLLTVVGLVVVAKGAMMAVNGNDNYQRRIVELRAGDAADRATATLMFPDAASRWIGARLAPMVMRLR